MASPQPSSSRVGPSPQPRTSSRARHAPPMSNRKPVVLIADDEQDARDIYAVCLEVNGFRAVKARDGEEAVALTLSLRPDVIVMDLAMPRLDGVAATRRLKNDPRTHRIPVILLTGYAERAIRDGALEAGAAVFLTKPCLPEDLEAAVRRLVPRPDRPTHRS